MTYSMRGYIRFPMMLESFCFLVAVNTLHPERFTELDHLQIHTNCSHELKI